MARCISPITLRNEGISVPCGKCHPCKATRASGWSFRLLKEAESSDSAFFVTLTYDLPILSNNKFMTLVKKDLQNFFKKLRHAHEKIASTARTDATPLPLRRGGSDVYRIPKIKYYACGEYGTKSKRPHYHIILLNADIKTLIGEKYGTQYEIGNIILDGATPYECDSWRNGEDLIGHITVGTLTAASVGYTLKYITKGRTVPLHRRDDREPEFSLMSKKIGAKYLNDNMKHWHHADRNNRMFCTTQDGTKIAMPRYFKEKIYTKYQREKIAKHMENKDIQAYQQLPESEKDILALREQNIRSYFSSINGREDRETIL